MADEHSARLADHDTAISEVEQEFAAMYTQVRHVLTRRAAAVHPKLTVFGYKLLRELSADEDQQQGVLADRLFADKGAISRIVRQLEGLGLVTRVPDPSDRRAQLVRLTDTARESLDSVLADNRSVLRSRLSLWEIDDIHRLRDLLSKVNETVTEREQVHRDER